ncbi:unnamed protein product [Rhizoctonia solani]|uniref:F-box domain-containing protein n=1 Tax=Rhizoctonia solani TaxID=456999 RepID=A0A8H3GB56_9AGAM|nr:unnamed protein product [Rhizoctonia solani]
MASSPLVCTCAGNTSTLLIHDLSSPDEQNLRLKQGYQCPFQVYKEWKKLHDQLSSTVNDYANACDALATVASTADRSAIESIFTNVDQDLYHLAESEKKLTVARGLLSMLRNRISTLCSIDILPDEILGHIFELASVPCVRGIPKGQAHPHIIMCPELLSSVCTRWRHVAINTCNLWTHLDLIPTAHTSHKLYNRARIWLRRVRSAPLHVHIYQRSCAKQEEIVPLAGFLAPLMKQLHTLHIEAGCHTMELFQAVLGCWIEFGHPGSTKSLILRRPNPIALLGYLDIQSSNEHPLEHLKTQHSYEQLDRFLLPLRSLRLHNVYMGWGTAALRGLSELHLEGLPDRAVLTINQLIAILHASPGLHSLKIARADIIDDLTGGIPEPIHLSNLQCLSLLGAGFAVLKRLLTLVVPGKLPLTISMNLYEQDYILAELQSFLDRSNLTALYLDARQQTWVPALFGHMSHLRSLAVRSYHLSRNSFPKLSPEEAVSVCAPRLESLYFIGCRVGMRPLRNMITVHSSTLRSLKLWRTNLYADSLSDVPDLDTGDVLDTFSNLIPRVQRSQELADYPVLGWEVCDDSKGYNIIAPYD